MLDLGPAVAARPLFCHRFRLPSPRTRISSSRRSRSIVSGGRWELHAGISVLSSSSPASNRSVCRSRMRTGIRHGDGRRVNVAKVASDGRDDGHGQGARGADDDGPEEGRTFAGCPAAVLERRGPEERRGRHGGPATVSTSAASGRQATGSVRARLATMSGLVEDVRLSEELRRAAANRSWPIASRRLNCAACRKNLAPDAGSS